MFDKHWTPQGGTTPVITGLLRKSTPTFEEVNRAIGLYYLIMGGLATIVQASVKDLLDALSQRPDLFRQKLKLRTKEAYARSEQLIAVFRNGMHVQDQYQLWLDVTDSVEESVKRDVQVLFYTVDNLLLSHNETDHRIKAQATIAYNLTLLLHDLSARFEHIVGQQGIAVTANLSPGETFQAPMRGMLSSMREVCDILVKDCDFHDSGQILAAMTVIAKKVCDLERLDQVSREGTKLSGVDMYGVNDQDNRYAPWNKVQESFLRNNYRRRSDEEMAQALGRTPGAVRARMRKLGLKRDITQ